MDVANNPNLFVFVSQQSFEATCEALPLHTVANKFGVLHLHDLKATMAKKGVEFGPRVNVYEVCNPVKAKNVLESNLVFNLALPCRVSVWEDGSEVKIGMMRPSVILPMLGVSTPELHAEAEEVERTLRKIITLSASPAAEAAEGAK